ncbi:MAG: universal stress protein [Acidobacteria bacterium]|nr:universal stress protein [Acidobacteriota bacterium]
MFPYRSILFPVDFSSANAAIVPYVREMTERFQANLQLVRACAPEVFYAAEFGWQIATTSFNAGELVKSETARLEKFAAERFPGLEPSLICKSGHAAAVIEDTVRKNGIDLIMLPTHGHGLFRRLLLGSITARLIHDLSCPVWTGCHIDPASVRSHMPYHRMICAVEPGMDNTHVVKAAERMAVAYSASLCLVSALEWPATDPTVDPGNYWDRMRSSAENDLAVHSRSLQIHATTQLVYGPIPHALRDAARQQPADLLIVGRGESQSALSGLLSNLYAIVRESPCPVLSV